MNQQHRFIFWGVLLIVVLLSVSSITFPIFVAQTVKNHNVKMCIRDRCLLNVVTICDTVDAFCPIAT